MRQVQLGISRFCGAGNGKFAEWKGAQFPKTSDRATGEKTLEFYVVRASFLLLVNILLCLSFSAQEPATVGQEEIVHYGDTVDVDVVGTLEFDWRGTLTLDGYLDGLEGAAEPVAALCRKPSQIAADIEKAYAKLLREPKVIVRIVDRSGRAMVTVNGAIRTPARFRLLREVRLRELIVRGGGFTDDASGEISIFRPPNLGCSADPPKDNGSQTLLIKVTDLLRGDSAADIPVKAGDIVDVVRAMRVYVIGAVNNPRPVYSRSDLTVSRAIATAGGLSRDAENGKATIFRREGTETALIEADLAKIKRGETVDIVLKPFDILDVAGKGGAKRKFPPVAPEGGNSAARDLPIRVID